MSKRSCSRMAANSVHVSRHLIRGSATGGRPALWGAVRVISDAQGRQATLLGGTCGQRDGRDGPSSSYPGIRLSNLTSSSDQAPK